MNPNFTNMITYTDEYNISYIHTSSLEQLFQQNKIIKNDKINYILQNESRYVIVDNEKYYHEFFVNKLLQFAQHLNNNI